MKNAFDRLISKCDTAEFSEHKERLIKMSQTEMQGEKSMKKKKKNPEYNIGVMWEIFKKYNMYVIGVL